MRFGRAGATGLAGAVMCAIAGAFAVSSLYVPGIALLALSLAAAGWVTLALRGARLTRWASAPTVQEDEQLSVAVALEHGRVPPPGGELHAWPGVAPLPASSRTTDLSVLPVSFARRGRHTLGPAVLRVADPLGLCVRELRSPPIDVLVLPRVGEVARGRPDAPAAAGASVGAAQARLQGALEVDSLRPHTPGAPASRIHWPTVARTGVLMQRRLIEDSDERPLIVIDPHHPSSEEALDMALRAAATLCVHLAPRGCAALLPGDRRACPIGADLRAWPAVHVRLALVSSSDGPLWREPIERAATVLWVSASATPPAALARAGGRDCYLVGPHPLPGRPIAFTAAGCTGQRVRGAGAAAR